MSNNTRTVGYWAEVARYMLPIGHWLITAPIHKASDFARMYLDLGRLGEPEATREDAELLLHTLRGDRALLAFVPNPKPKPSNLDLQQAAQDLVLTHYLELILERLPHQRELAEAIALEFLRAREAIQSPSEPRPITLMDAQVFVSLVWSIQ